MIQTHEALWRAIEEFDIDGGESDFPFASRLAAENGWPLAFSKRVVDEYKKFLFLSQVAGHPVTPSDEVDQAWHLHMVYTRSYWERLCGSVLRKPLHHDPTRGGGDEEAKFDNWYSKSLESYQRVFGHTAPRDVWPTNEERFSRALRFRRVDVGGSFVIPKRRVRSIGAMVGVGAAAAVLAGCAMSMAHNTSDDAWVILGVIAVFAVIMILVALIGRHGQGKDGRGGSGCGGVGGCGSSGCAADSGGSGCGSSGCGGGGCGGGGD